MKFCILKNRIGQYRVGREMTTGLDKMWKPYDECFFSSIERAREHQKQCEAEHADFLARTTWEPVE